MIEKNIINTITAFGFTANSEQVRVYSKFYDKINYQMSVDFTKKQIDYGPEIKKGDNTTSHLENPENIVVLECVDRLLEKGYKPADLTLEKKWKLGRTAKSGKADITVRGKNGKTLLIIECKTWGKEYEKELDKMKSNGGQLFSYYQQDKNTRYLCLYASREHLGKIEKANALIKVEDSTEEKVKQQETEKLITYEKAKTIKEMLEVWKHKTKGKMTFLNSGLFEPEIEPYNPGYIPLKISDLKDFGKDDKGKVFNQFEEILRHNNISDRSNAFNRIISLILAKIVDENKGEKAITDFQIKEGIDDAETLLERLQSLYSKAMRDYLGEEVIDYKLEDIEAEIANFPRQTAKETLYRIYKELKFYQNNEFAFKEVYNKKLFEENAKVLEEVVRLFQKYRFKYDKKAQFLGDFFELMLESGYKQSEGQFFTPTPIARFIISSIPLKSIVQEKLKNGDKSFLPKVIDFACGSGHFLTEAIAEIAELVKKITEDDIKSLPDADKIEFALKELRRYKQDMRWAGEYIYGIEKDYRLARTSQVACFMHGDGDANIIFGDGLEKHPRLEKDGTFDVLIANPPYTIKDFKKHLNINPHDFELWEYVTPDSDDIEVFFIERMKQLLRPEGMAGIILPSSILSNGGPYTKAREIILKYFEIKAIVEFGGNTFGATSTNTVTLFLKKRNEDFVTNCRYIAEDFISENRERKGDFINSTELFENYVAQLELEIEDYRTFIARNPNDAIKKTEFYKSYKNWFDDLTEVKNLKKRKTFNDLPKADREAKLKSMFFDLVLEIETEKFFYFLLTHRIEEDPEYFGWYEDQTEDGTPLKVAYPQKKAVPQKTLIVKTSRTTKEQEKFLGYKFSNRRGYKGIDFTGVTLMYDRADPLSPKKVNSYIHKNFLDEKIIIDESLSENLSLVRLTDCINFEKIDFDKRLNLSAEFVIKLDDVFNTKYDKPLKSIALIQKGSSITKDQTKEGDVPVVAGGQEAAYYHNESNRFPDIITVSASGAYAGFVNYWTQRIFASDCTTIKSLDEKEISTRLIFHYLKSIQNEIYQLQRGQAQPHIYPKDIERIKIPVPPPDIQKKIISEIEDIEAKEEKAKNVIKKKRKQIEKEFEEIYSKAKEIIKLSSNNFEVGIGNRLLRKNISDNPNEGIPVYSANVYTPFGYTKEKLLDNFDTKTIIWGIDGDWQVNVINEKIPFYPTDHCGYIRIVKGDWQPNYLSRALYKVGLKENFSRSLRASIARIKELKIPVPDSKEMLDFEKLVINNEKEILSQEQTIANTEEAKKAVLIKYLKK